MGKTSGRQAKERAAAARAKAEAEEKRRQRLINIGIAVVVVVVVVGLIGGALLTSRSSGKDATDASATLPAGVLPAGSQYEYGVDVAGEAPGKPVVEVWEDFQCPACKGFEDQFGPMLDKVAEDGDARIIWRTASFLDASFPGDNSKRATAAWGCAIDAGKKNEYHKTLFDNHPEPEGKGWTDDTLIQYGSDVGIAGEDFTTFEGCVRGRDYIVWANNGTDTFSKNGVNSTPSLFLNGVRVTDEQRATPETLLKAIEEAGPPPAADEGGTDDGSDQ